MSYSDFKTLEEVVQKFNLNVIETDTPLVQANPIEPSPLLVQILERELSWATAVGGEKARSEGIIAQVLLELREQYQRKISVFSGKEFNVNPEQGLNGYCDFLISASPIQTIVTAPVLIIAESKRGDLELGYGQCVSGMIGAQQFNQRSTAIEHNVVYGTTTNGTLWKFFKLDDTILTIDLNEYSITSVDKLLGILHHMVQ